MRIALFMEYYVHNFNKSFWDQNDAHAHQNDVLT